MFVIGRSYGTAEYFLPIRNYKYNVPNGTSIQSSVGM